MTDQDAGHLQPADQSTWIGSDRPVARFVARPVADFLRVEASGGILLLAATVAALVWVNSPWDASYGELWHTELGFTLGSFEYSKDLQHWVNDGLMAVFFFVVGLEIKRELVVGDLSDRRAALLPALAALGGVVLPAVIYATLNAGGVGSDGWGIPMATDIAFAVGVLTLFGDRIPTSAKLLLLALAIVDDILAILVIAVFYTDQLQVDWLLAAVVGLAAVAGLRRVRVWYMPVYVVMGVAVWWCTLQSGVHATIAGVALGLATPARPLLPQPEADQIADRLSSDVDVTPEDVREVSFALRESVSVAERTAELLHPWSSYVIIPIFALANAGIALSWDGLGDAATSSVTLGVVAGLVVGKPLGILAAVLLATRAGITHLPADLTWRHLAGVGTLAGIGFTVSLFITGLAFDQPAIADEAAIGVLVASAAAAGVSAMVFRRCPPATDSAG